MPPRPSPPQPRRSSRPIKIPVKLKDFHIGVASSNEIISPASQIQPDQAFKSNVTSTGGRGSSQNRGHERGKNVRGRSSNFHGKGRGYSYNNQNEEEENSNFKYPQSGSQRGRGRGHQRGRGRGYIECNHYHKPGYTITECWYKQEDDKKKKAGYVHEAQDKADEEDDLRRYRRLYEAALKGDWEAAKSIFQRDPDALMARITSRGETALHVAIDFGRTEFIEKLVEVMPPEALEIKEHDLGHTALHNAAIYGNLSIVKTLVTKNGKLTEIKDKKKLTPLSHAANYLGSKEVVQYLITKIPDVLPHPENSSPFFADYVGGYLTSSLISSHSYDICHHLLEKYPFLATAETKKGGGILSWLAFEPSGFQSGSKLGFWEKYIYQIIPTESHRKPPQSLSRSDLEDQRTKEPPTLPQYPAKSYLSHVMHWINGTSWTAIEYLVPGIKHIKDKKYKHKRTQQMVEIACKQIARWNEKKIIRFFTECRILRFAAQNGAVELITTCLQHFPYLIGYDQLLEEAILYRQERVFNLFLGAAVYQKEVAARYNKKMNENIVHKAARLAPYPRLSSVSCPALQMQRELQWFKAVEKLVNPTHRSFRNKKWKTPREIFTTEHRELLKDAEKWMKDTSNSCMLVSTLITTVVFAAAFTVPGGNVEGKGIPLFLDDVVFLLFAASDALALFSSTTSILMFLSILTARYAEDDFLRTLPKRLILGFASLFLAIATLMVAFGATLCMVLSVRFKWIFIPIMAVTTIPVALFVMLQLPLFIYMVRSTYGSGIFHPERIW